MSGLSNERVVYHNGRFVPGSQAILEKNMTFAYEPMLVRQGFGTACVEDLYVVTATGCERLSEAPERLWD